MKIIKETQTVYDFNELENQIKKDIINKVIPSVSLAVSKNGMIIYEKAFGYADIENQILSTIDTSYQLASASKPITATGVMLLDKKSDFSIYDPIEKYIHPLRFKNEEGSSKDVKTIDVLNHTAGLGTYMQISYLDECKKSDSFEEAFQKYGSIFHPPGLVCEYSNLGYGLLDYLIGKQSKKTFSQFMEEELFEPLNMKNAFVDSSDKAGIMIAKKYTSELELLPQTNNNTIGAGNIYASIHDLILFSMFSLKNDQNYLLDPQIIDLMQGYLNKNSLYHLYDSTYYGLGWYYKRDDNGYKTVWHEGGMMGASAMIKLFPEENISVTVLLNTFNQQYCQNITNQLSNIVLPNYHPTPINEISEYQNYTSDPTFFGTWKGSISVDDLTIPCTLYIQEDGNIIIEYLDFTYKSYFTQNNPIYHKTYLMNGLVNQSSFIGTFPGDLPADDIRHEFSQFLSLKLIKQHNILSGTIVALAAANREYYAYPFYIKLERE